MQLMETSCRRCHRLWTLRGVGVQHAEMQRKALQGKQHKQKHWGEEMLEQMEHEEGRDKAGNIGPRQITEVLGCSARNLGFMLQSRGVYIVPHSSAFPEQSFWPLASLLAHASSGGKWERSTTHLILPPAT